MDFPGWSGDGVHAEEVPRAARRLEVLMAQIVLLLVGPIVWALHLTAIYGAHAVLCARDIPADIGAAVVMITTGVALLALLAGAGAAWPRLRGGDSGSATASFQASAMGLLALLSAMAIAGAGGTALIVPACAVLR
jgi:hypothetical protein